MAPGSSAAAERALPGSVRDFLRRHAPDGGRVTVALSGGVDSVTLATLLAGLAREDPRLRLGALHVDHGISPRSGEWAEFCRRLCGRLGLPLAVVRARVDPRRAGLEERARDARREAYAAQDADYVALAHHRDDQAETLVFRALRGSGVRGLACMAPRSRLRPGCVAVLLRPLLGHSRAEIRAHAEREGLDWVEDESNRDDRIGRNLIRNRLLPVASRHFPACRESLASTARALRDAERLLGELAGIDHRAALEDGGWSRRRFREVGATRTANWLRHVLEANGAGRRSWRQIGEIARQVVLPPGQGARLSIDLGAFRLVAHGDRLCPVAANPPAMPGDYRQEFGFGEDRTIECPLGRLDFVRDDAGGIGERALREGRLELRAPAGGERLSPGPARPRRRVRDLLREAGIPPCVRAVTPVLHIGGELAAVPGVAVDARLRAASGAGYFPAWRSHAAARAADVAGPAGQGADGAR